MGQVRFVRCSLHLAAFGVSITVLKANLALVGFSLVCLVLSELAETNSKLIEKKSVQDVRRLAAAN